MKYGMTSYLIINKIYLFIYFCKKISVYHLDKKRIAR